MPGIGVWCGAGCGVLLLDRGGGGTISGAVLEGSADVPGVVSLLDEPLTGRLEARGVDRRGRRVMRTEEKKRRWGWRLETIGGELQRACTGAGDRTRPAAPPVPCPPQVTACSDSAAIIGRALAWGACFHASKIQAGLFVRAGICGCSPWPLGAEAWREQISGARRQTDRQGLSCECCVLTSQPLDYRHQHPIRTPTIPSSANDGKRSRCSVTRRQHSAEQEASPSISSTN